MFLTSKIRQKPCGRWPLDDSSGMPHDRLLASLCETRRIDRQGAWSAGFHTGPAGGWVRLTFCPRGMLPGPGAKDEKQNDFEERTLGRNVSI